MKRLLLLAVLLLVTACTAAEPTTVRLMTHDSFDIGAETLAAFTAETGITVEVFKAGDAGQVVNQAVLAKDDPLADVLYGVDNTFLSRALENDLFVPYEPAVAQDLLPELRLDPQHRVQPVDYGDVCLNYDRAWFAENGMAPPQSLDDLVDPAYAGLTVVENPATSSPGLAFLLATVVTYGTDGYLDFWQALVANDVLVASGWEEAYYGAFTAASDGDRPIVVSYASSPPAEVYFAETAPGEAPTGTVTADGACFRQIEFVGILQGTRNAEAARKLVDFMLSPAFQEDIPLHMFVFPANATAVLPDVFATYAEIPPNPATLAPDEIAANREAWINAWTDIVLR